MNNDDIAVNREVRMALDQTAGQWLFHLTPIDLLPFAPNRTRSFIRRFR